MTSAGSWARWSLIALLGVLVVAVLVLPLPSFHTVVWAAIENAAHAPIFGAVALLAEHLLRRWPRFDEARVRYLAALLIALTLGVGTEVLQFFGPRDASFGDLFTNALGAVGALAAHAALFTIRGPALRALGFFAAAVCVLVVIAPVARAFAATLERDREFPVLADFDSWFDLALVTTRSAKVARIAWPAAWGSVEDGPALRVDFAPQGRSGVVFEEPVRDWSGYRTLVLDIANPEPQALELRVLIDDALHDRRGTDRYIGVVSVAPHAREMIRIPLEEIERGPGDRMLDLTQITAIMLFRADGNRVVRCYLGPIRLE